MHREHLENLIAKPPEVQRVVRGRLRPLQPEGGVLEGTMPGLVGALTFPVWLIKDGRLLSIRSAHLDPEHLVLPCPEVFRTMYSPHRILALALLGGPWETTAKLVVDPAETKAVDDGSNEPSWHVTTVEGLGSEFAALAANLWLGAKGRAAANRLWPAIHAATGSRGVISATLPFDWETLEIEVACIPLQPRGTGRRGSWFGYAITSIRWPDAPFGPPAKVSSTSGRRPPSDGTGVGPSPVDSPSPIPEGVINPDPWAFDFDARQSVDPSAGSGSVEVTGDGPAWTNVPEVERKEREAVGGGGPRRRVEVEETTQLSSGQTARGRRGAATAQTRAADRYGGDGVGCPRFELVLAMLDRLVADGSIMSHDEVPPPSSLSDWGYPVFE